MKTAVSRNPLLLLLFVLLIAAQLGRGLWAAQQDLHSVAMDIDPWQQAIQHGHFHLPEPGVGHFHADELQLDDSTHKLLHSSASVETQQGLLTDVLRAGKARSPLLAYLLSSPPDPAPDGLYRPPRTLSFTS